MGSFCFGPVLILFFFLFLVYETGTHYVAQTGLELLILLPQCWDYRYVPPHPAKR
jgi:hypothetical protein